MHTDSATIIYSNPLISPSRASEVGKQIFGLTYTPCRLTLRGRPNQMAGDIIRAYDSKGNVHNVLVMEQTLVISGGLKSVITCPGEISDDAEFYSTSPLGKDTHVANAETVAKLQAYADSADANILKQAKKYTDEMIAQSITEALGGSY